MVPGSTELGSRTWRDVHQRARPSRGPAYRGRSLSSSCLHWGPEQYRFELRPEDDATQLVFTHVFDDRALAAQHAAGWEVYFNRLEAHLTGGFLSEEDAHERITHLQVRYAERFDLES